MFSYSGIIDDVLKEVDEERGIRRRGYLLKRQHVRCKEDEITTTIIITTATPINRSKGILQAVRQKSRQSKHSKTLPDEENVIYHVNQPIRSEKMEMGKRKGPCCTTRDIPQLFFSSFLLEKETISIIIIIITSSFFFFYLLFVRHRNCTVLLAHIIICVH
jgi:hypothetical protein